MVVQCGGWSVKHKRLLPVVLLTALLAVGATLLVMALRSSSLPGLGQTASPNGEDALSYAVVVDAGSSGSRVYLFQWSSPGEDAPAARGGQLLRIDQVRDAKGEPLVMKVDPGLSSYKDQPSRALAHMRPLLDFAARHIPTTAHPETQLFVLATAGLRLIPEEASAALLRELRTHIPLHYAFLLPEGNVQVISGREEGMFSWISLNYLLGRFRDDVDHTTVGTVGSLDMGGGSLQVAFEVEEDVMEEHSGSVVDVDLSCGMNTRHKHKLFVTTYLGFGANEARRRYVQAKTREGTGSATRLPGNTLKAEDALPVRLFDPCAPVDMREGVPVSGRTLTLHGTGEFSACKRALLPILQTPSNCSVGGAACTSDTFTAPPISEEMEFYGFSEFWYTMQDVFKMGGAYEKQQFEEAAIAFCSSRWSTLEAWHRKGLYPEADEGRMRTQCFKSAWMSVTLHEGLRFPSNYTKLVSAKELSGHSLQWALGALVYHTRCHPVRSVEQSSSAAGWHPAPSTGGLSENMFHILMLLLFATVILAGFAYSRMLRVHPLRAAPTAFTRALSFASLSRTKSCTSSRLPV